MRALEIWMLDDGTPGHWSMTEGLVRLFSCIREVTPVRVPVTWRWGAARQLFQWLEKSGFATPDMFVRPFLRLSIPASARTPDLIVSRGGGTLFPNAWLARKHLAPNIFIGTLRGMPERLFSAVVLHRDGLDHPPYFRMPAAPTRIDPATLADKASAFPWTTAAPTSPTACLLLGGDGSGFLYQNADWHGIARGMIRLHEETGVRWCVSSSRRTPPAAEALLRKEVPASAIHEACWWHEGDRRPCLEAFLAVSATAYCTTESMSMLEECVNAGKPTIALSPESAKSPAAFRDFLQRRECEGRIAAIPITTFQHHPHTSPANGWHTLAPDEMLASACKLLQTIALHE
jgi:mitochondrial fission protein ELM1